MSFYQMFETYSIPTDYDPDVFSGLMYDIFDRNAPVKTGNMESHTEYDIDYDYHLVTFTNTCEYAAYQNYETSLSGWFTDGLAYAYNHALDVCPVIPKEEKKAPWWRRFFK